MTTTESSSDPLNPFQRDIDKIEARIDSLRDPKLKAIAKAQVDAMRGISIQPDARE